MSSCTLPEPFYANTSVSEPTQRRIRAIVVIKTDNNCALIHTVPKPFVMSGKLVRHRNVQMFELSLTVTDK